ncbi:GntR family transcriptional regulator [Desertibaculum subflavum]|uniref:GntR family transcriptional regulator n=1 Tax=Desertibaculum subflavum TaxID=2268458 RepID=UPI000E668DB3
MASVLTPASLTDLAAERIREAVMRGELRLGEKISEASLAAALRMSKTPVREALVRLSNEGLVIISPRRGTFVFRLTREEMAEISGFRFALESSALRLSFERDRQALIRILSEAVATMTAARKRGDLRGYGKADADFHCGIIRGCDNRYLVEAYQRISARVAAIRTHMTPRPRMTDTAFAEHHRLVRLLQFGRLQAAIDLLGRHIDRNVRYYVRETLDPAEPGRAEELRRKLGMKDGSRQVRRRQRLPPARRAQAFTPA